jgi:uncharacterized membrane protein
MIPPFPAILIVALFLIILDAIYIGINKNTFSLQIVDVQRVSLQLKPVGVVVVYAFIIFALYWFIIREKKSVYQAFLLGLVIYAVYDFTSYALLKKWRLDIAIMDTLWGGALFALATYFTYQILHP